MNELFTNSLINESSPYLLQHAHNPVNWVPWSDDAFRMAAEHNKLVLVSIGYSSCHWCHVMEKESFEDAATAEIMNRHFICIKVDREERPDVDAIYMDAVQLMSGRGGWPLNCIVLPDKRPLYGGTYFPKSQWQEILVKIATLYSDHPQQCNDYAEELTKGISNMGMPKAGSEKTDINWDAVYNTFSTDFDKKEGGMKRAPKFPMPSNWHFLLSYFHYIKNDDCLNQIKLTLQKMAFGGIYDQVAGGFARYSTDALWKLPHFEKMLYDNAQLVSLYSHAFLITKEPVFKEVVSETLDFIRREMTSPEEGFYSALDADSEGVEGKFYIWDKDEIEKICGEDASLIKDYYNINEYGYLEDGHYILIRKKTDEEAARDHGLSIDAVKSKVRLAKKKLLDARQQRRRPGTDDKQICSWNSLMITAYLDAFHAIGEESYLETAIHSANHILKHFFSGNNLLRIYKNGVAKIPAFLDDYALLIEALTGLYRFTGDETWLSHAFNLTGHTISEFYDEETGLFYYTGKSHPALITRKTDLQDNVIPSANSVMAKNLHQISYYYSKPEFAELSAGMIRSMHNEINSLAPWYSNWAEAALIQSRDFFEAVVYGENAKEYMQPLMKNYRPDVLYAFSEKQSVVPIFEGRQKEDETLIYICRNRSCYPPVANVGSALTQLQ